MMLLLGIDREVDDMDALLLVELVGPLLVQIVLAEHEVPEGAEARILLDEVLVGLQIRAKLGQVIAEEIVWLRLVGYDQDAIQLRAVCEDFAGLEHLLEITVKKLRQQTIPCILVRNQLTVQRILREADRQQPLQLRDIFLFYAVQFVTIHSKSCLTFLSIRDR